MQSISLLWENKNNLHETFFKLNFLECIKSLHASNICIWAQLMKWLMNQTTLSTDHVDWSCSVEVWHSEDVKISRKKGKICFPSDVTGPVFRPFMLLSSSQIKQGFPSYLLWCELKGLVWTRCRCVCMSETHRMWVNHWGSLNLTAVLNNPQDPVTHLDLVKSRGIEFGEENSEVKRNHSAFGWFTLEIP